METLRLDAVVFDDDARAADDLAGVALTVDLAETSPGSKHLRVSDLDQVDLVLRAEGLNELDVLSLRAGLDEDAQVRLALVQGLGALAEATSQTVVNEGVLQDLLQKKKQNWSSNYTRNMVRITYLKRILNRELALGSLGRNLDLSGGVDLDLIRSVRHPAHGEYHP